MNHRYRAGSKEQAEQGNGYFGELRTFHPTRSPAIQTSGQSEYASRRLRRGSALRRPARSASPRPMLSSSVRGPAAEHARPSAWMHVPVSQNVEGHVPEHIVQHDFIEAGDGTAIATHDAAVNLASLGCRPRLSAVGRECWIDAARSACRS